MTTRATLVATCGLALLASMVNADGTPRYAEAMQEELQKLGLDTRCEELTPLRHRCSFPVRSGLVERELTGQAVYDEATDTIYVYVERLHSVPVGDRKLAALLQRMMELNWELLIGKFEWNPKNGEVRLSAVQSTDSNFDRRAFRSLVRSLDTLAARYRRELSSLSSAE